MEVENLKRAFQLICCCCCRRNTSIEDHPDNAGVDTTEPPERSLMKSVGPSSVSVTPHSRVKALSFVVGVDSIDALVSDFEDSVSHVCNHNAQQIHIFLCL